MHQSVREMSGGKAVQWKAVCLLNSPIGSKDKGIHMVSQCCIMSKRTSHTSHRLTLATVAPPQRSRYCCNRRLMRGCPNTLQVGNEKSKGWIGGAESKRPGGHFLSKSILQSFLRNQADYQHLYCRCKEE